jgi:arylsulfatase A-like enzyme
MCSSTFRARAAVFRAQELKTSTADGLAEHDKQIGQILAKLDELGLSRNAIVIYTTDNGAYQYMWPEGGTTPFSGRQGNDLGRRRACAVPDPLAGRSRRSRKRRDRGD